MARPKVGLHSSLEGLRHSLVPLLRRINVFLMFFLSSMLGLPSGVLKLLMPKMMRLPDGVKVWINDLGTIRLNIPDQYLRMEYEALSDYVPQLDWVVADVGAYIGLYSLRASRIVGDRGFVVAFEPNAEAFRWLLRNIELNNARNIRAYDTALGDSESALDFYVVTRGNIGASSPLKLHIRNYESRVDSYVKKQIPVTSLDSVYFRSGIFEGRPISLLKVDVEGFELNVLKGSKKLLDEKMVERLVVEVHLDVVRSEAVEGLLKNFGYGLEKKVRFKNIKEVHYYRVSS